MWVLENEGGAFEGKRLWLRPGKRYLFGRTVAEPGQLAIKGDASKSVSRKHCTITIGAVPQGDGENASARSRVTVEDLKSKCGTKVNDTRLKGPHTLSQDSNTLQMGNFQSKFRITWFPVVLSYSFTAKELRADPTTKLRQNLEQLDIKYLSNYDETATTHIVTKKRNTPKGLQALINGRHIVNDGFVNALAANASPALQEDGVEVSKLEQDFDGNWPKALEYLPPPGDEAVPRPAEAFSPDGRRVDIFDGYTFIFYEMRQFDSLMAPINTGKGKALYQEVIAGETEIDDFIRFVKGVAGEKGLGEFEDGSEGKGVVVVRWMPKTEENLEWFTEFYTQISLRLDHRLIDQKDFLDAILGGDASVLRRPLETDTEMETNQSQPGPAPPSAPDPETDTPTMDINQQEAPAPPRPTSRRTRAKGQVQSRFKGFSIDIDEEEDPKPAVAAAAADNEASQEGLFVSQDVGSPEPEADAATTRRSQRKRPAASDRPARDVMEDFAPTAAQVKRRRIAAGEDPVPRQRTPAAVEESQPVNKTEKKSPKIKKEFDVLDMARQHREEAEARARAEREELAAAPEGLDLAEIRRLHIEEPMELRRPPVTRTREQDIEDGRWDPAWNGRKNFKRFRRRDAQQGRQHQKIIVPLQEVQAKAFGIGDDYWLEDDSQRSKGKKKQSQSQSQVQDENGARNRHPSPKKLPEVLPPVDSSDESPGEDESAAPNSKEVMPPNRSGGHNDDDDEDDDEDEDLVLRLPTSSRGTNSTAPTRSTRQSQRTSQSNTSQQATTQQQQRSSRSTPIATSTATAATTGKRAAPPSGAAARAQPAAKRSKVMTIAASDDDDDESEDELRFKFGRR